MKKFCEMNKAELETELGGLNAEYEKIKSAGLKLDMSRGKPSPDQIDCSDGILTVLKTKADCRTAAGADARNYGMLAGIPEARSLFAELCGVLPENVIVGGNSSLTLMYDAVVRAMLFGAAEGKTPWINQGKIKFLCPCPGYDRHFAICQDLGIEMINIPMTETGPDMDMIERLLASDEKIKGIWCVPKYSNPTGVTYDDKTVLRFAHLSPKAEDFRIFWDNAYIVHDFGDPDRLINIFDEIRGTKNENLVYMFTSTSKITYPGAGVAVMVSSKQNVDFALLHMGKQSISYDKINQLRHVKYFGTAENMRGHMKAHAAVLKPKFDSVLEAFEARLGNCSARWTTPHGGYFISLDVLSGTAKRVFELCKNAGVTLTNVGATFPYGIDAGDENLRIAPSYPTAEELKAATQTLCVCVKLAEAEKRLSNL